MPDGGTDGGVDVVSGACAPAKPPPKKKKEEPKKKSSKVKGGKGAKGDINLGEAEDCTTERTLRVKPGTCTWFLVEIRGKRLTPRGRTIVGNKLKKLVVEYMRPIPSHTED